MARTALGLLVVRTFGIFVLAAWFAVCPALTWAQSAPAKPAAPAAKPAAPAAKPAAPAAKPAASAATPADTGKMLVAVLDLEPVGATKVEASAMTDRLREELLRTKRYTLVDRTQMQSVLDEQALQQSGCTSQECAVQVGRTLGVRKLISGKVTKISDTLWLVNATMVDVETSETELAESLRYRGDYFSMLDEGIVQLAKKLIPEASQKPDQAVAVAPPPAPKPAAAPARTPAPAPAVPPAVEPSAQRAAQPDTDETAQSGGSSKWWWIAGGVAVLAAAAGGGGGGGGAKGGGGCTTCSTIHVGW